ncbi:MAG: beta strand repeat-containing protein [Chthoniobacterales bacterium]
MPIGARAAQTRWVFNSLGNWFISSNWTAGVPDSTSDAIIRSGGTAFINAPGAATSLLRIGLPLAGGPDGGTLLLGASNGTIGDLTIGSDIYIGNSTTAGDSPTGTVTVSAGAKVLQNAGSLFIGTGTAGATGNLTITGTNSFMSTAAPTFIGTDNSHGNFTVQSGGGIYTGPAELADGATSSGAATVTGTSSEWIIQGGFTVGYAGSGTFTISAGGYGGTGGDSSVAAFAGSTGTVLVTGTGSQWNTSNVFLGGRDGNGGYGFQGGNGSLKIQSGGVVQAANLKFFGGTLQVDNGSYLSTPGLQVIGGGTAPLPGGPSGDMVVGNTANGRMEITGTGVVDCNIGYIGLTGGITGYVFLSDDGKWNLNSSLFVGYVGDGTLEITGRSVVSGLGNTYIGLSPNNTGNVMVRGTPFPNGGGGADSNLVMTGNLYIGGNTAGPGGIGVLRIEDFGNVGATATTVWSTGGLAIGGTFASLSSPLTVDGGFIQFVLNNGTTFYNDITLAAGGLRVFTTSHPSTLAGKLTGSGGLTKNGSNGRGLGTLTLTGASNYSGPTSAAVGTLLVNGSITSPVTVSSGATLGGSGAVGAVTVNSGGIVAPGNSPGKLTVNGNYTQSSGAILNIEIGGAEAGPGFDQIAATGIASVNGILNVSLVNLYRPKVGDTFAIITSNGESGNFATINTSGFTVSSTASATGIVLTITDIDPLLRIISIARSGNNLVITYDATGGKSYRLERKAAITDTTWLPIPGVSDQSPGVNGPAPFTDPNALGLGKAFYRVRILP